MIFFGHFVYGKLQSSNVGVENDTQHRVSSSIISYTYNYKGLP